MCMQNCSSWSISHSWQWGMCCVFRVCYGPQAKHSEWEEPLFKAASRVSYSVSSGSSPSIATFTYGTRVTTICSYRSQLLGLCGDALALGTEWLASIYRVPWNSVPNKLLFNAKEMDFRQGPSIRSSSLSALFRAARQTLRSWRYWYERLRESCIDIVKSGR